MRGLVLVGGANASVPVPTVSGPISSPGAAFITPPSSLDLTAAGYVEEEYFVEGTASAYSAAGAFLSDGRWAATPASTAPYKTRILVRRPTSPRKFNRAVLVEWLNVAAAVDAAADRTCAPTLELRNGAPS